MKTIKSMVDEQEIHLHSNCSCSAATDGVERKIAIIDSNNDSGFEFGSACELFLKQPVHLDNWYQGCVINNFDLYNDTTSTSLSNFTEVLLQYEMLILTDARILNSINSSMLLSSLVLYHQSGGRLVAFGGGMLVLAQAGLLDGKNVPGKSFDEVIKQAYPKLSFCEDLGFCFQDNIYVAGYGFNTLELGLFLIGTDWGASLIESFVEKLSLAPSLATTLINRLEQRDNCSTMRIQTVLDWAQQNLEEIDNVDQLAEQAYLSRRSFDRQFRAAMGVSAKDWLTQQRLIKAKEYLVSSQLSIEEIAMITGFGNSNNFRNNFQKLSGYSPTAYRRGDFS